MMSSYFLAALLPLLASLTQAKTQNIYSFAEGKSSPDGLKHGARGLECIKTLHGSDRAFLKDFDNDGKEVTDDEIAAALYMAYGKKGIDSVCEFTENWGDEATRRMLRTAPQQEPIANAQVNTERQAQPTRSCGGGMDAKYPSGSKNDPDGVYTDFITNRLKDLLPRGPGGATARMEPAKVVEKAQKPLDDALEGEYHSILCGTYYNGFAKILSIPDFVVFDHEPILEGINQLSCGIAERVMQSNQSAIRALIFDGMKHNDLVNRAEMTATYENSRILAEELCAMSEQINTLNNEISAIKEKVAAP